MGFASIAFKFSVIQSAFEDQLLALLSEGDDYVSIGWDDYDASLEIYGCTPSMRLSLEAQAFLFGEGFGTIYVNHSDKWQTHYSGAPILEPSRIAPRK